MILDLHQLFVLGVICSSVHWIVARSKIAKPFWSRARGWLGSLLECPACVGTWLGLGLGVAGLRPVVWFCAEDLTLWTHSIEVVQTALLGTWLTPVFEGILLWGLERSAIVSEPGEHDKLFADVDADAP